MSSTRKAKPGAAFRQERYASSPEFERGLLANLVAARCGLLDSAEDRKLIWFVQFLSHQEGGRKALCNELLARYGDRIGTASMHKFGTRDGQVYNAEQVRAIREGMPIDSRRGFMLRGELDLLSVLSAKEDRYSRQFVEENEGYLVLLCYVESTKTSSNFRPQQWQKPIHRSNHGRILLSVCSHVTPEVFFGAQVDDRDE